MAERIRLPESVVEDAPSRNGLVHVDEGGETVVEATQIRPYENGDIVSLGAEGGKETEVFTPKYDLVIVDFHGTVTDHQLRTIRAYHHAAHDVFGAHLGKEFYQRALTRPSAQSDKEKRHGREQKTAQTNKEFIEEQFLATYGQEAVDQYLESFRGYVNSEYLPIPGMPQSLQWLIDHGVEVAALTNGSQRSVIQEQLRRWRLDDLSDNLYSSHITGYKKPDRKAVDYIMQDYNNAGKDISYERTLMVGDYIDDIRTAHTVGMDSVLIVRGPGWETIRVREPRPTYIITEATDLLKVVSGEMPELTDDEVFIPPVLWKDEDWNPNGGTIFEQK